MNTKDQRSKQKLERERAYLIERATKINPSFKPPHDFRSTAAKKTKKIYIPAKQYPDYNFIGLIIGPRGLTQKELEKESGAKIVIRGKGSVKDGRQSYDDDKDELHVLLSADTTAQLKKAAKMVKKLLVPVEEGKNQHKFEQLRKLAEINGTLRDANAWQPRTWKSTDVYCKHCGEISHPTTDCPLKKKPVDMAAIDRDYEKFMSEIGVIGSGGTAPGDASKSDVEASYEQFMASFRTDIKSEGAPPNQAATPAPWNGGGGYNHGHGHGHNHHGHAQIPYPPHHAVGGPPGYPHHGMPPMGFPPAPSPWYGQPPGPGYYPPQ